MPRLNSTPSPVRRSVQPRRPQLRWREADPARNRATCPVLGSGKIAIGLSVISSSVTEPSEPDSVMLAKSSAQPSSTGTAILPTAIAGTAKPALGRPPSRLRRMCQPCILARPSSGTLLNCMSVSPRAARSLRVSVAPVTSRHTTWSDRYVISYPICMRLSRPPQDPASRFLRRGRNGEAGRWCRAVHEPRSRVSVVGRRWRRSRDWSRSRGGASTRSGASLPAI